MLPHLTIKTESFYWYVLINLKYVIKSKCSWMSIRNGRTHSIMFGLLDYYFKYAQVFCVNFFFFVNLFLFKSVYLLVNYLQSIMDYILCHSLLTVDFLVLYQTGLLTLEVAFIPCYWFPLFHLALFLF